MWADISEGDWRLEVTLSPSLREAHLWKPSSGAALPFEVLGVIFISITYMQSRAC